MVRAKRPRRRKTAAPVWFIAPGYVLFVLTIAYPVARAVQISLYDWKVLGRSASEFIGLGNYRRAVNDPRFWRGLGNAGVYMAITVPAQVVAGPTVATLLHRNCPARTLFRVLYYLPVVTSWVVVSLLLEYLFADDGLVNYGARSLSPVERAHVVAVESVDRDGRHCSARCVEGNRLGNDDLSRRPAGRSSWLRGSGTGRRRRPVAPIPRRYDAGHLAGHAVRLW